MFNAIRGRSKPSKYITEKLGKCKVTRTNGSTVEIVDEERFIDPRLEARSMSPVSRLNAGEISMTSRAPKISVAPTLEDVRSAQQTLRAFVEQNGHLPELEQLKSLEHEKSY